MKLKYVIYTKSFNEDSGGIISLHKLCHMLNALGEESYIYIHDNCKHKNPNYETPIIDFIDESCIVVYPDIINGNPLNAKKVVRWNLFFKRKEDYKNNDSNVKELHFYYSYPFGNQTSNSNRILWTIEVFKDIYYDDHRPLSERKDYCVLLRKGRNRPIMSNLRLVKVIDGKPHNVIADIFRQSKFFISYDLFTMYLIYAALCGCVPIVIPDPEISSCEWRRHHFMKYGIAYGIDEVDYAVSTRDMLIDHLNFLEKESLNSVKNFVMLTKQYFNDS